MKKNITMINRQRMIISIRLMVVRAIQITIHVPVVLNAREQKKTIFPLLPSAI